MPIPGARRCSGGALGTFWAMQVMLCPLWAGAFGEWDTSAGPAWALFPLWFGNASVWDSGGWSPGLPTEHPCTRVIPTTLVPKFAVAVGFLI